jgi:hypothetical protein
MPKKTLSGRTPKQSPSQHNFSSTTMTAEREGEEPSAAASPSTTAALISLRPPSSGLPKMSPPTRGKRLSTITEEREEDAEGETNDEQKRKSTGAGSLTKRRSSDRLTSAPYMQEAKAVDIRPFDSMKTVVVEIIKSSITGYLSILALPIFNKIKAQYKALLHCIYGYHKLNIPIEPQYLHQLIEILQSGILIAEPSLLTETCVEEGYNILHIAAIIGDMEFLIALKKIPTQQQSLLSGLSATLKTSCPLQETRKQQILSRTATINFSSTQPEHSPPLFLAAMHAKLAVVKFLIEECGVNCRETNPEGDNLLHLIARKPRAELQPIAHYLVDRDPALLNMQHHRESQNTPQGTADKSLNGLVKENNQLTASLPNAPGLTRTRTSLNLFSSKEKAEESTYYDATEIKTSLAKKHARDPAALFNATLVVCVEIIEKWKNLSSSQSAAAAAY